MQKVLLDAFVARAGGDRLKTAHRCVHVRDESDGAAAEFVDMRTSEPIGDARGRVVIACDGINSAIRKQFFPEEGPPRYSGGNMWRGTTRWQPILSGKTFVRAGWLSHGKMVIYPIRDSIDAEGRQLVNWVAELETPVYRQRDWNRPGQLDDFIGAFAGWHFDWLDVPAFLRAADEILEFPMVDQDPLPRWTFGHATLLGGAAHPMVPRGSNGAGQAILDARALAAALTAHFDPQAALAAYEAERREATTRVVLANRANPPDAILREVYLRTGDKPFGRIEDVISQQELVAITDGYKAVAGYAQDKRVAPL